MKLWRVAALVVMTMAPATAQAPPCGPAADVLRFLQDRHQEALVFKGTSQSGNLWIITMNRTRKWTLLQLPRTSEKTRACFVAVGTHGALFPGEAI